MEIGPQRTINKAGLVAGFAAPLCEPGDGSCESPSASEPGLVLVQLSDEDDSAARISLFREPAARHRRSKLPCDDPLPRESSRSSVPVVDALLGGRGPRPAADCRGGKHQRRDERDADTRSHMTHLHSNDGPLASSIGSGRWMGDKRPRAPALSVYARRCTWSLPADRDGLGRRRSRSRARVLANVPRARRYSGAGRERLALKPDAIATPASAAITNWIAASSNQ